VPVLDRFTGGGAIALSGSAVYAGGGTRSSGRSAVGVTDSADAMFAYLSTEAGDAVPAVMLKEFCDDSVAMLAWLEAHGVPFEGSLCPDKTSYPTNRLLLGQRTVGRSRRAACPERAPHKGPWHIGQGPVRRPRGRGERRERTSTRADPRRGAGHRRDRPDDRRGVPEPAPPRRAVAGAGGALDGAPWSVVSVRAKSPDA
jgi:hypothetical protein